MRATECHSRGSKVDPSLLDNVHIPCRWSEYLDHGGSSLCTHSIVHSEFVAGGKDTKEGRQTVFFTAEDLMTDFQEENTTT